jgi:hypothetical protein
VNVRKLRFALVTAVVCTGVLQARGQTPASSPASAPAPSASPAAGAPPASAADHKEVIEEIKKAEELVLTGKGGYNYDPAGRRDPFVNPIEVTDQGPGKPGTIRPEGWPGMLIGEVQLQGITVYGGEPIALFLGTDGVGYFAREGDELWDGKIISIDFDEGKIAFQQKVEDPSSPVRFREVVKKLNP